MIDGGVPSRDAAGDAFEAADQHGDGDLSRKDRKRPIRLTTNAFSLRTNGRLYVAKVGDLRVKWSRGQARVADRRRDFHHKLSTQIIRDNQAVFAETLSARGLGRTRIATSVHDAGWAQFVRMLEYKARKGGRTFVKVGRSFPSSQVCSAGAQVRPGLRSRHSALKQESTETRRCGW
jgi:IS605 OrfB family transposase